MSKKELRNKLLQELEGCSRNEVSAVATVINNKSKYSVPTYGSKDQLVHGLEGVDGCVLDEAMDAVLSTDEYDEDSDVEEDDTDDETDDEDED